LFERIIRRPLLQIAKALDAEAKGEPSETSIRNYVDETDILIQAFSNMKEQVHSRQKRLESILDNAAEGIITIDENGQIETFNIAAQQLFGYKYNEIVGENISILISDEKKQQFEDIFNYIEKGIGEDVIGVTREIYGKSKNGLTFPMSIKLGEMDIEGKHYLTAVVENISKRKAMIDNLQRLAEHDSLTGLFNRHYFTEELDKFVTRKIRGDKNYVALLYIDLDNFKYINDTMGHLAGDQLIVEAASILNNRTREGDILARIGGDEFAVLLYRPDPMLLEEVAESFRKQFESYVFKYEGKIIDVACSIGAAVLDQTIKSKEQLLAKADFACHEAKRMGRNMIHIFTAEDDDCVNNMSVDIGWTHRIKHALEHDRFILACQPICNTVTQKTEYFEVLLRMLDERDEIIMPAGFLPAAERFSLITLIDFWVIENSVKYIHKKNQLKEKIKLSINLSANSIEDMTIVEKIKRLLNAYDINPHDIMFEVTESAAMGNLQKASSILGEIQALGCKTALDDFGIGYSSFAYLKDLPIDVVKIDGSFVKDSANNSLHYAMVRSINDIAHEMEKQTVAEFVEDETVMSVLRELGVDYGQGYYLGKPEIITDIDSEAVSEYKSKKLA
jgi:diguanylate cyclase (GGDEF)-like protein/PAS domain S-box-containing protein